MPRSSLRAHTAASPVGSVVWLAIYQHAALYLPGMTHRSWTWHPRFHYPPRLFRTLRFTHVSCFDEPAPALPRNSWAAYRFTPGLAASANRATYRLTTSTTGGRNMATSPEIPGVGAFYSVSATRRGGKPPLHGRFWLFAAYSICVPLLVCLFRTGGAHSGRL